MAEIVTRKSQLDSDEVKEAPTEQQQDYISKGYGVSEREGITTYKSPVSPKGHHAHIVEYKQGQLYTERFHEDVNQPYKIIQFREGRRIESYYRGGSKYSEYITEGGTTKRVMAPDPRPEKRRRGEIAEAQKTRAFRRGEEYDGLTESQWKKAKSLTHEAQMKEYGRVVVKTGKELSPKEYGRATSFTEQEQYKRYGRVVSVKSYKHAKPIEYAVLGDTKVRIGAGLAQKLRSEIIKPVMAKPVEMKAPSPPPEEKSFGWFGVKIPIKPYAEKRKEWLAYEKDPTKIIEPTTIVGKAYKAVINPKLYGWSGKIRVWEQKHPLTIPFPKLLGGDIKFITPKQTEKKMFETPSGWMRETIYEDFRTKPIKHIATIGAAGVIGAGGTLIASTGKYGVIGVKVVGAGAGAIYGGMKYKQIKAAETREAKWKIGTLAGLEVTEAMAGAATGGRAIKYLSGIHYKFAGRTRSPVQERIERVIPTSREAQIKDGLLIKYQREAKLVGTKGGKQAVTVGQGRIKYLWKTYKTTQVKVGRDLYATLRTKGRDILISPGKKGMYDIRYISRKSGRLEGIKTIKKLPEKYPFKPIDIKKYHFGAKGKRIDKAQIQYEEGKTFAYRTERFIKVGYAKQKEFIKFRDIDKIVKAKRVTKVFQQDIAQPKVQIIQRGTEPPIIKRFGTEIKYVKQAVYRPTIKKYLISGTVREPTPLTIYTKRPALETIRTTKPSGKISFDFKESRIKPLKGIGKLVGRMGKKGEFSPSEIIHRKPTTIVEITKPRISIGMPGVRLLSTPEIKTILTPISYTAGLVVPLASVKQITPTKTEQITPTKVEEISIVKQITPTKTEQITATQTRVMTRTKALTRLRTITLTPTLTPSPTPTQPPTPEFPPFTPPAITPPFFMIPRRFGFKLKQPIGMKRIPLTKPRRYTPTIHAVIGGITMKKPKGFKLTGRMKVPFTGLEQRPILI